MKHFLRLISKGYFFFLFILLELICFFLIKNNLSYQRSVVQSYTNQMSGHIYSKINHFEDYLKLDNISDELAEQNEELLNKTKSAFLISDTCFHFDTLRQFRYTAAKVVHGTVNKGDNYFMINKGRKHGITEDMGVISPKGVVGITISTSNNFAVVLPLINKNFRTSACIKKNDQLVNVSWLGDSYRNGIVNEIPSHIQLQKGDTLITSGRSLYFPKGIDIGVVSSYDFNPAEGFNEGVIDFSIDFNRLENIYVIKNLLKEEQQQLIDSTYKL